MKTLNELDKIGAELLTKLPDLMQSGTLYATELYTRFIKYALVQNSIGLVLVLGVLGLSIVGSIKWARYIMKEECSYSRNDLWFVFAMVHIVFGFIDVVLIMGVIHASVSILQIVYVPELYLINYFK